LKEYSIPHLRRAGRISIPEDSFDRIREARDLHREGLGTESVRRRLEEGNGEDLATRLDGISEALEDLRGNLGGTATGTSSHEALRTILARQTLLISAVSDLTGMVEDLLAASGQPRREQAVLVEAEDPGPRFLEPAPPTVSPSVTTPVRQAVALDSAQPLPASGERRSDRHKRFGVRGRRRRLLVGALALFVFAGLAGGAAFAGGLVPGPDVPQGGSDRSSNDAGSSGGTTSVAAKTTGEGVTGSTTREVARAAEQRPVAGRPVALESDGEPSLVAPEVPDVAGKSVRDAIRELSGAELRVEGFRNEPGPQGVVMGTDPSAGSAAAPGDEVYLVVGGGQYSGTS
jgi:hypothetical protein